MKDQLLVLSTILLFPFFAYSAPMYILFDENCMDVFEYKFQNKNAGEDYDAYQLKISPTEKVVFEVNPEGYRYQNYLPAQYISCQNADFDRRTIAQINRSIDEVYIVQKKGRKKYYLLPVMFAAYYQNQNGSIDYISPKYQFRFNTQTGTIGEDVSYNNPNADIYFEAKLENECSGAFLLRQYVKDQQKGLTYIVFVPEVGIVEERNGANSLEALENTVKLEEVNGKNYSNYLQDVCEFGKDGGIDDLILTPVTESDPLNTGSYNQLDPGLQDRFTEKGSQQQDDIILDPRPQSYDNRRQPSIDPTPQVKYHTVKKGETLYRISKKYGITVGQIKDWNNLSSNTIYRNDKLLVSGPVLTAREPAPYDFTEKGAPKWETTNGTHTVKRGETLAYLAMMYGYTETRFREINNLPATAVIKVGQVLRTTDCEDTPTYNPNDDPVFYDKGVSNRYQPKNPAVDESKFIQDPSRNTPVFYDLPESGNYRNTPATGSDGTLIKVDPQLTPKGYDSASYLPAPSNNRPGQRITHTVKDGDTLYSLANQYGVSVEHIRQLNNMEVNEILIPHQKIYID
ncbi:MAG: LysM peptidoglycan-binding domain-containing protein [Saprospiraceae bacterium]|nr:LysM peptidoglycan-binding domain-containing protein [Saprospiraceae bacterium]